ncbi:DNA topoisomerase [Faecalibacterium prausnitzii]|uniref:DNA topoisomerase n=1 Tax=Faecalibacterium prausnitzii TaxID=853 RepID=UPI003D6EA675
MPSSNKVRKVTSENYPTDAGREGELIFRFVYQLAGCTKPVKRLWISSMEDAAIREGFANLRPDSDYDALYQSALCRAKADWLVGINATRLFSVLYHKTLTVGRVQTPTLKMLVDRDAKILRFQKEKYYTVGIQSGSLKADSGRIASMDEANTLKATCAGTSAICTSIKRERKAEQPPKLYDLTALQREANRLFGFTAKQTLDYAQQLYEKKLLTYPRTDSQYLTEDMGRTAQHLVSDLLGLLPFAQGLDLTPEVGRVLNSKKVSDHHAIIPTAEFAKQGFTGLAESECKLMNLVCSKLLCAIAAPHEYETVTAVFSCAGNEFAAKGKTVLVPGWKEIDQRFRSTLKADGEEETENLNTLPELTEGQSFRVTSTVSEHFTSPPKAYTEDTLLSVMERAGAEDMPEEAERKGLGTPATRAAILEKLVQMGFVQRKGKQLVPTKDGINLAVVLPESLTSPALTAEWENRLTEIAQGNADPDEFMAEIEAQVRQLVKTYSCISADKQNLFQSERVIIGKCPRCGENVYEGKKNFYCGNRGCQFVMWKNDRFFEQRKKAFTPKIAAALLKNGKAKVKGLYSEKTGKTYDATVLLADTGGKYVNYRVERKE